MKPHLSLLPVLAALLLPTTAQAQTEAAEVPAATSVGIGAGWSFPQDLLTPDVAGVRFRFSDALSLEANVDLSGSRTTSQAEGSTTEAVTTDFVVRVGSQARFTLAGRGALRLEGLGGGYVEASSHNVGVDDTTLTERDTFSAGLTWGLGVTWFLNSHIGLSADAINPLLSVSHVEEDGDKSTTVRGGLTYAPAVRAMVHVWF